MRRFERIAKDICGGLAHLHKDNILHRDIACRNLLMKGDGTVSYACFMKFSDSLTSKIIKSSCMLQVLLTDFGLSRKIDDEKKNPYDIGGSRTPSAYIGGTTTTFPWPWTSPESFKTKTFTKKVDLITLDSFIKIF